MKLTLAILRGIKDTLSWQVLKVAIFTGIPLGVLWLVIAYLLWQPTVAFTSAIIGWVPFSILKANGAFLIGAFAWFQLVLVTFGTVIAIFNVPIFKFVPENKFEYFSILLLLFIALGWTLFAFFNWDLVINQVSKVLTWFPFQTLQLSVAFMLAALIFYNLFIVTLALLVLVYHKPFLHCLQKRDYPDETLIEGYRKRHFLRIAARDAGVFFLLMIVFFPLFFVPFINLGLQVLLWAWLIKDSYFLAAASLYATDNELKVLKRHSFVLWGIAFMTSLLNLVPVINVLSPFFALIVFFHWSMLNRPHLPAALTNENRSEPSTSSSLK